MVNAPNILKIAIDKGNILTFANPDLSQSPETYLSAAPSAGGTSLTVYNNAGFSNSDYIIVGKIGGNTAELRQISAIGGISGNTTINIDALKFSHSLDEPVTWIKFNQIKIYKSATKTGTYSLLTTIAIGVNFLEGSRYDDLTGLSTDYYKATFYNSTSTNESSQSSAMPAAGFSFYSLKKLQDRIVSLFPDPDEKFLYRDEITDVVNEAIDLVVNAFINLDEDYFTTGPIQYSLTSGTQTYSLPTDCVNLKRVEISYTGSSDDYQKAYPVTLEQVQSAVNKTDLFNAIRPIYYLEGTSIGFLPTPDNSNGYYKLWYSPIGAKLVNQSDELPLALNPYTDLFINYGLYRMKQKDKKYQEANEYYQLFKEGLGKALEEAELRQYDQNKSVSVSDFPYSPF